MAIINYTETNLSNGNKLIVWSDLTYQDTGQPYQLNGYKISSVHIYRTNVYDVKARLWASNESATATRGFPITDEIGSTPDFLTSSEFTASYEWIYPRASGSNGTITICVLISVIESGILSAVAYSGSYNDLTDKPPPVTGSAGSNGYVQLPNGLIIQWGQSGVGQSDYAQTFPIAFPNTCLQVIANVAYDAMPNNAYVGISVSQFTKTSFMIRKRVIQPGTITVNTSAYPVTWIAVGY